MAMEQFLNDSVGYEQLTNRKIRENRMGHFALELQGDNLPAQLTATCSLKRHDFDF